MSEICLFKGEKLSSAEMKIIFTEQLPFVRMK